MVLTMKNQNMKQKNQDSKVNYLHSDLIKFITK